MRLQFNRFNLQFLFSPEDVIDKGLDKSETIDDKLDFLNRDVDDAEVIDLETDKKDDKSDKEDKDENKEDDDLKELEESLEDEDIDADKLELAMPVRRSEILKEYPDLFKKFPALEKSYYRDQQFSEILPTIEDAKEAVAKAEILDKFEADLFDGKTELMLKSVKDNDPNAFNKIADNYLSALASVDKTAYHHVISNITKYTIQTMIDEASGMDEGNGNKLKIAAHILNQFVFGSSKFSAPTKLSTTEVKNENEDKLDKERKEFIQTKFDDTVEGLNTKVNNSIKSTIEQFIDPKNSMTEYVKKHAVKESLDEVSSLLEKDTRFKSLIDRLWDKAARNNFKKELVDDIRNAYMSRAKTVLPTVIKTARNNALKGMGKRVSNDDGDDKKGQLNRRSASSNDDNKAPKDKDSKIPKGMSNLDFMMRES